MALGGGSGRRLGVAADVLRIGVVDWMHALYVWGLCWDTGTRVHGICSSCTHVCALVRFAMAGYPALIDFEF